MYKGFFEDVEYVMGLFLKPFEECCDNDLDEDKKRECGMACDEAPCFKEDENKEEKECGMSCDETACSKETEDEDGEGPGCDALPCMKNEDDEEKYPGAPPAGGPMNGLIGDTLKCLFNASDIDYDYED